MWTLVRSGTVHGGSLRVALLQFRTSESSHTWFTTCAASSPMAKPDLRHVFYEDTFSSQLIGIARVVSGIHESEGDATETVLERWEAACIAHHASLALVDQAALKNIVVGRMICLCRPVSMIFHPLGSSSALHSPHPGPELFLSSLAIFCTHPRFACRLCTQNSRQGIEAVEQIIYPSLKDYIMHPEMKVSRRRMDTNPSSLNTSSLTVSIQLGELLQSKGVSRY